MKLLENVLYQNKEGKQDRKKDMRLETRNRREAREIKNGSKRNTQYDWGAASLESDQLKEKKSRRLQNRCLKFFLNGTSRLSDGTDLVVIILRGCRCRRN